MAFGKLQIIEQIIKIIEGACALKVNGKRTKIV